MYITYYAWYLNASVVVGGASIFVNVDHLLMMIYRSNVKFKCIEPSPTHRLFVAKGQITVTRPCWWTLHVNELCKSHARSPSIYIDWHYHPLARSMPVWSTTFPVAKLVHSTWQIRYKSGQKFVKISQRTAWYASDCCDGKVQHGERSRHVQGEILSFLPRHRYRFTNCLVSHVIFLFWKSWSNWFWFWFCSLPRIPFSSNDLKKSIHKIIVVVTVAPARWHHSQLGFDNE